MIEKKFTDFQLARLPKTTYLVQNFKSNHYNEITIICIGKGKCKYTRELFGLGNWSTLLWSCCTTQKQIEKGGENVTYEMYDTFDEMISVHPEFNFDKAPNDPNL